MAHNNFEIERTGRGKVGLISSPPDLFFPETISSATVPEPGDPFRAEIVARFDKDASRYRVSRLVLDERERDITTAVLRQVALAELFRRTVERGVLLRTGEWVPEFQSGWAPIVGTESLSAARIYAVSKAYGEPPLKAVAEAFDVSQSTATRMVARARAEGLLP